MTLTIEDAEFDQAVRELAAVTGEPESVALKVSVQERLGRVKSGKPHLSNDAVKLGQEAAAKPTVQEIKELVRSFGLEPANRGQTEDEILGYGPNGYCE